MGSVDAVCDSRQGGELGHCTSIRKQALASGQPVKVKLMLHFKTVKPPVDLPWLISSQLAAVMSIMESDANWLPAYTYTTLFLELYMS